MVSRRTRQKDFDEYVAGGYWLANDLAKLLNRDQLVYYADKIDEELQLEERSYLISQILSILNRV